MQIQTRFASTRNTILVKYAESLGSRTAELGNQIFLGGK